MPYIRVTTRINSLNWRYIKANGEDNQEIIMIMAIIKIDIDWVVEIEGHHSEVEVSMNRIIREDHNMSILIEMTLEETILEKCKIIEVKILEVDTKVII